LPIIKKEYLINHTTERTLSKVPEVTLIFWIIKIAATTLGETAGDAVSMSMDLGYLVGTAIFQQHDLSKTGDSEKVQILVEYALVAKQQAASGVVADLTTP